MNYFTPNQLQNASPTCCPENTSYVFHDSTVKSVKSLGPHTWPLHTALSPNTPPKCFCDILVLRYGWGGAP